MFLKNAKFDLFGSENASWQICMVANRDWLGLRVTVLQTTDAKYDL